MKSRLLQIGGLLLVFAAVAGTAHANISAVPEIDPGSIGSALTLLAGGALILVERIRGK